MHRSLLAVITTLAAASFTVPALAAPAGTGGDQTDAGTPTAVSADGSRVIYLAGQLNTTDLADKPLPANFLGQARASFGRIQQTLKQSKADLADIVMLTVYVTDVRNIPSFGAVVKELFPAGHYPATSVVAIKNLGVPGALIEIQATAVTDGKGSS